MTRFRNGRHAIAATVALVAALGGPAAATAQVQSVIEIRDGEGQAIVRNGFPREVDVVVAVWESDESARPIELLRPADLGLWPIEFRLAPGEVQTLRLLARDGPYPAGTVLRLETRFIPVEAAPVATTRASAPPGVQTRLTVVTRILSKIRVE